MNPGTFQPERSTIRCVRVALRPLYKFAVAASILLSQYFSQCKRRFRPCFVALLIATLRPSYEGNAHGESWQLHLPAKGRKGKDTGAGALRKQIKRLMDPGLIETTTLDKPQHRLLMYRFFARGKLALAERLSRP